MYYEEDEKIARDLQLSLNAVESPNRVKRMRETFALTDPRLEYYDPTPNIRELLAMFSKRFFWGKLDQVDIQWSWKMKHCAGLCYYRGPSKGPCWIKLSAPLLTLRPRKDLIHTLLHEMIHAYLFLTAYNTDREEHGPLFREHMHRINSAAGTNITVYHTFFDEVDYYRQHIWRCNGRCQYERPYFGFVKRAVNRPPGPSDFWWKNHQNVCGGTYIKIGEPQKPILKKANKNDKPGKGKAKKTRTATKDIRDYLQSGSKNVKSSTSGTNNLSATQNAVKGATTSNQKPVIKDKTKVTATPEVIILTDDEDKALYDHVRNTVRKAWGNKYLPDVKVEEQPGPSKPRAPSLIDEKRGLVACPVCSLPVAPVKINEHIDDCLSKKECVEILKESLPENEPKPDGSEKCNGESLHLVECLVCGKIVEQDTLNEHLESCVNFIFEEHCPDDGEEEEEYPCPCCTASFTEREMSDHIDKCLAVKASKEKLTK